MRGIVAFDLCFSTLNPLKTFTVGKRGVPSYEGKKR